MGHGVTEVAAVAGYQVHLRDVSEELVRDGYNQIEWSLNKLVEKGQLAEEEATVALERIETYVDLLASLRDADVVIEVVPERMELKKYVYQEINPYADGETLLATNTSTLSISELSEVVDYPHRFCGMDFFNPPT